MTDPEHVAQLARIDQILAGLPGDHDRAAMRITGDAIRTAAERAPGITPLPPVDAYLLAGALLGTYTARLEDRVDGGQQVVITITQEGTTTP